MKNYKKSLFIFHRDLRIQDNTGLIEACKQSDQVIPCFIFDPKQVEDNSYKSENIIQFMIESLQEVHEDLQSRDAKLYIFYGQTDEVVEKLIKKEKLDAIFSNRDYTPFAKKRDHALNALAEKHKAKFFHYADALLTEPEEIATQSGDAYQIYSAFFRSASQKKVKEPQTNQYDNFYTKKIEGEKSISAMKKKFPFDNKELFTHGGRKSGFSHLHSAKKLDNYYEVRNLPAEKGTTGLSAHHKFGTISIRESYHYIIEHLGKQSGLIGELYWRDFFTHIAFHYPHVFGQAFRKKYNKIKWKNNKKDFTAWKEGKTGFPIVDAGMRQLNTTGYMHNRVRMIVASFLVKDLLIDWRWGEKYFAQQLVDYDPSVNNGNWQWAASTGCDAQPYFRIFNPWLQQKKYDPDCEYIKKWVPELAGYDAKEIHKLEKEPLNGYPEKIVDHKKASAHTKQVFKKVV